MDLDSSRLKAIRLVIFDVDGVLTDGKIDINANGMESKSFHVRDGYGIRLLTLAGLEVAFLSSRRSPVVDIRAEELGVRLVYHGVKQKIEIYDKILNDLGLSDDRIAYAGDDLIDLRVMRRAGVAMAPADAVPEIREVADYVCRSLGGCGAAREMAEVILKGAGLWQEIIDGYH